MKKCFYAYPAEPISTAIIIENAIKNINDTQNEAIVESWKNINPTGQFIVDVVCDRIDECDVFVCDLTHINRNVLFELGYAIAAKKRIWISYDEKSHTKSGGMRALDLEFLTTTAYSKYSTSDELAWNFITEAPYNDLPNTIYSRIYRSLESKDSTVPKILYLKGENSTGTSRILSRRISSSNYDVIIDDPLEVLSRPLHWYIEHVFHSLGVIAHFLSDAESRQSIQNAKYSLICGIAVGFGKSTLMVAKTPHKSPIDYRDYLIAYEDTNQCLIALEEWFQNNTKRFDSIVHKYRQGVRKKRTLTTLKDIYLGEYVAEDEQENLTSYFIETSAYEEAKKSSNYLLFVGRKGTGKTANLTKIATEFQSDEDIFVCIVKPSDYELEGIFELFQLSLTYSETSNLVESLWKYLIYTEIAKKVYNKLLAGHTLTLSEAELRLKEFVEGWENIILNDFTVRLEKTVSRVCNIDFGNTVVERRSKVSEILHMNFLNQLQLYLKEVLHSYTKVVILIDNLDKAWSKRDNIEFLANFLYGLLNVGDRIPKSFGQEDDKRASVQLSLIVFLRTDILNFILTDAREPDKLKYSYIEWDDYILLQRVVEERFLFSLSDTDLSNDDVWSTYFVNSIDGLPTKQFLVDSIIPRPRDIIFVCKQALTNAINHLHTKIERDDLLQALQEYSKHVYLAMLAETEVLIDDAENLFIGFAGSAPIVTRQQISEAIEYANLSVNIDHAIDVLCDVTFLGLETKEDVFEYIYDASRKKIIRSLASKLTAKMGVERYQINKPFYKHLGIE